MHLINVHSIFLYNNFENIGTKIGNNTFYYDPLLPPITIPSGNYNLKTFNKYLSTIAPLYQVVQSYDGLTGVVCKYLNSTDKNSDVNRIVQNVDSLSQLNNEIKTGIVWCEWIYFYCDIFKNASNERQWDLGSP